jgi:hypothetical protein
LASQQPVLDVKVLVSASMQLHKKIRARGNITSANRTPNNDLIMKRPIQMQVVEPTVEGVRH